MIVCDTTRGCLTEDVQVSMFLLYERKGSNAEQKATLTQVERPQFYNGWSCNDDAARLYNGTMHSAVYELVKRAEYLLSISRRETRAV